MMEEKDLDFTKPLLDLSPPVDRSVPRCCLMRQIGYLEKKTHIPNELQWAAEDSMINKEKHDEFKCNIPDFSRSTFLMVFSPDGKKVASTHGNHNVYVTDLTSGKNVQTLTGHPRTPWCIAFHPSSNQILASGCLGGQVRVWDLHGGSEIWTAESQTVIASLAFHPIDKMLVIASYNELHFWDWSKSEPFAKCYTSNEKEKVRYVAFDHVGDKLITGVANAPVRVASQWDRVSVPQPPPAVSTLDAERRITICYRYMVEQYEHLIQHYVERARARATMDRGTDPMDVEAESSHSSASTAIPSTSTTQQSSVSSRGSSSSSRGSSSLFDFLRRRPNTSQTTASNTVEPDSNRNTQNSTFSQPNRTDYTHSSQRTTQNSETPEERDRLRQRTNRVSAGTDATSASRSSTLLPINHERVDAYAHLIRELTEPGFSTESLPYLDRAHRALENLQQTLSSTNFNFPNSETSSNRHRNSPPRNTHNVRGNPSFLNRHLRPSEINPRNNSDLPHPPSFNSRSRDASSAGRNNPSCNQPMYRRLIDSPPLNRPLSGLSPETIGFGIRNQPTEAANPPSDSRLRLGVNRIRQLAEDFLGRRRSNLSVDSTDMNPLDSDNEHREESSLTRMAEQVSLDTLMYSFRRFSSSGELSQTGLVPPPSVESFIPNIDTASPTATRNIDTASPTATPNIDITSPTATPNIDTASPTAASRSRNPPRRLYAGSRTTSHHSSHVMSAEYQASERRLLNRLNEILERPLEPRPRRFSISRRSAFQPRQSVTTNPRPNTTNSSTSTSPELERNRLEMYERYRLDRAHLGLQQVRRILEDLQSQIYALHGVVRSRNTSRPESAPESGSRSETEATPRRHRFSGHDVAADTLTDEDSDGSVNDNRQWRSGGGCRRFQVRLCRRYNKFVSQNPRSFVKRPHSVCIFKPKDGPLRFCQFQSQQNNRRPTSSGTSSPQQATTSEKFLSERGEASSSHVSGETSTGTSEEPSSVRGVKRKSNDSEPLFRPRPSSSAGSGPSTASQQPSNIVSSMRDTIMQLESMIWRARTRSAQRNIRLSRFTRQREERMMRNLWDTESSHESSRDDQSEGDSSQPSGNGEPAGITDWARLRQEATRLRARRELEYRRHGSLPSHLTAENETWGSGSRFINRSRRLARRYLGRSPETWRRSVRRNTTTAPPDTSQSTTPSTPSAPADSREQREPIRRASTNTVGGGSRGLPHRHQAVYANIRNAMLSHRISVPVVHINGLPLTPADISTPRPRPHSPPPYHLSANSPILTPRLLHPRYGGPSPFDESTSEDSSPQDRSDYSLFTRGNNTPGYGSVVLNEVTISPHHRIQAWDFSRFNIPDISNADKNIVVSECKIHNDASVDISQDGCLLVTLLPSGRLSITTMLGVYSLQWETLGQLLYTTSFEQNAVSVSLSPTTRHLVVGLASRRIPLINNDRFANAQVYRLEGANPGKKVFLGARGRLVRIRDFELGRNYGMSLNCIRWAPSPGQGLVYGTNTGQLTILR